MKPILGKPSDNLETGLRSPQSRSCNSQLKPSSSRGNIVPSDSNTPKSCSPMRKADRNSQDSCMHASLKNKIGENSLSPLTGGLTTMKSLQNIPSLAISLGIFLSL